MRNAKVDIWRAAGGALGAMVLVVLLLMPPSAWAGWGAPVAVGERRLEQPIGVAVNQSNGNLYVGTLSSNTKLDAFNLAHELLPPSPFGPDSSQHYAGTAINPTTRDLYALNVVEKKLDTINPANGELLFTFEVPGAASNGKFAATEIASDGLGNVYVPEPENNRIGVFTEKGEAPSGGVAEVIKGVGEHALVQPTGVAVDPAGHVWIADTGDGRLEEFEPNGAFMEEIKSEGVRAVAADSSGDVFASRLGSEPKVIEYRSGVQIEEFGQGIIGGREFAGAPEVNGITIDDANQIVYVADGGHNVVWAFTKGPVVTTGIATNVTASHGLLHGSVNPAGEPLESCEFEYASEAEYQAGHVYRLNVPCVQTPAQIGSGTSPVAVTGEVDGLKADETYHFRLHASNHFGSAVGGDNSFTAITPVFGFQLGGPFALQMSVSNAGTEHEREQGPANTEDLDTQAGSHPFDVTSRFIVNTESNGNAGPNLRPKDFYVDIPAGFAGSVARIPRCRMSELTLSEVHQIPSGCPTASQVGVVRIFKGREAGTTGVTVGPLTPVYNMVPPPGVPAELAFNVITVGVPITFQVRSDGNYGITAEVPDISEVLPAIGSQLTLWGVPADPRHDAERFLPKHFQGGSPGNENGEPLPAGTPEVPFLTNPTRCGSQEEATVTGDSWLHPGLLAEDGRPVPGGENWVSVSTPMFPDGITGCEKLTFHPELEVKPETSVADSPTGLTVDLRVPQSEAANNLATPSLKEARVTLPQGLSIAPSQARAREGCTPAQIKLHSMAAPECPGRSQIGKLELVTPLLPEPLTGQIYLSSEREGNVFHVYLVIEGQGVLIKLDGSVEANEQTGQLTTTFKKNPQLPFSELKLTFFGGNNASLVTPNSCGSYGTRSLLKPWSDEPAEGEAHGTPDAEPAVEPFEITSGCAQGFAPGFHAGMENPVAGAYSPFSLAISRNDGEQEVSQLEVSLPKGLVGKLAGIEECSTAQIEHAEQNTGTAENASPSCPAGSQIGTVQAGAGPGENLFFAPGKIYLTGPYKGAPYGAVAIVPALAGPFDLGTVVVRDAINIDPHTAQVSVSSDPLPKMLDGIPLQVRRIEVAINRPGFALNPTSCEPTSVTGMLHSFGGAQQAVSARFQVGDCGSLAFKPGFKVATHAKHTRRNGEYLRVNVTSGPGQANIRSVFVKLPKVLPSRVSTLNMACSAKQFEENPAGCPEGSKVGTAIAHTPILATSLSGPAIFVSHGGAAFPDLDIVLQGSGITVDLTGNTNIAKGITSSSFGSVPDVPVSSFELTLPAGPHSALAGTGNLCYKTVTKHGHKTRKRITLTMPTTITGQNGAVVKQSTHIAVEGCAKAGKHKARKRKHHKRK